MIGTIERRIIELMKESCNVKLELTDKELYLEIQGDKTFAHDIALAYQGLVQRQNKKQLNTK